MHYLCIFGNIAKPSFNLVAMKDSKTARFAVSLNKNLLTAFDQLCEKKAYPSRSKAVQDLIQNFIIEEEWEEEENAMGTITLAFDHHKRNLSDKLTDIQHDFHTEIISSMHVHLDDNNCLEVIAVKGKGKKIRKLADLLIGTKGVIHGKLTLTTDGKLEEKI